MPGAAARSACTTRKAGGYCRSKPDAARMQALDRGNRARCQHLAAGDEGTVAIGDAQRDLVHRETAPPEVRISTPSSEATITAELRPPTSPFSTTPPIDLIRPPFSPGFAMGP